MNFKLLWITPGFPGSDDEHNCLPVLQLLALVLQKRGVQLKIIALGYPHHTRPYSWHGMPVRSCDGRYAHLMRFWNWRRAAGYAEAWHQEKPFDAVHSFWLGPAWVRGKKLAKRWSVPHVCTLMGQDILPSNRYLKFLKTGDEMALTAVSHFQKDFFFQKTGITAGHVVPWGIDAPEPMPESARDIDVIGAGSLIGLKNWDLWLETVALVSQMHPDLKAVLCGDGSEKTRLKNKATALGLNVTFAGEMPRPEVLALMRRSKVFLHTSTYESFGFVLVEAAAHGCRLVSTPVGIAPEMADCGETAQELAALVFPQGTPQRTIRTMEDVAGDYLQLYGNS